MAMAMLIFELDDVSDERLHLERAVSDWLSPFLLQLLRCDIKIRCVFNTRRRKLV